MCRGAASGRVLKLLRKPSRSGIDGRPKRRDLRAGADQLWIELGINRLADAGTAANDALAASITAMRTSSLSTSTTHGLGELIAVVRECADAAATAGKPSRSGIDGRPKRRDLRSVR